MEKVLQYARNHVQFRANESLSPRLADLLAEQIADKIYCQAIEKLGGKLPVKWCTCHTDKEVYALTGRGRDECVRQIAAAFEVGADVLYQAAWEGRVSHWGAEPGGQRRVRNCANLLSSLRGVRHYLQEVIAADLVLFSRGSGAG